MGLIFEILKRRRLRAQSLGVAAISNGPQCWLPYSRSYEGRPSQTSHRERARGGLS